MARGSGVLRLEQAEGAAAARCLSTRFGKRVAHPTLIRISVTTALTLRSCGRQHRQRAKVGLGVDNGLEIPRLEAMRVAGNVASRLTSNVDLY